MTVSGPPPAATEGVQGWWNQTTSMNHHEGSPGGSSVSLAYDPLMGDLVAYGGCGSSTCPGSSTWVYDGYYWANATANLSTGPNQTPPAVFGAGLTWDPAWGGLLLTGGELAGGVTSNQTWLFSASGWLDETANVSSPGNASDRLPHIALAATAFDSNLNELVVVNGWSSLVSGHPIGVVGETYALGGPGTTWTDIGLGFSEGPEYPGGAAGPTYQATMAYDPSADALVYFGGENSSGVVLNETWELGPTRWSNVTPSGSENAAGVVGGSMTWAGQSESLLLVGGKLGSGAATNASYVFGSGGWTSLCGSGCPGGAPPAEYDGAIASNSSSVGLLLLTGNCTPACVGQDWVYELSPDPSVVAYGPNPSETTVPIAVNASNPAGAGSGPLLRGTVETSHGELNMTSTSESGFGAPFAFQGTFTIPATGAYTAYASVTDFFGITGTSTTVGLDVNATLAASASVSPNPDEVGTPVSVSASVTAGSGVGPLTYAWTLGDGGTSSLASLSHSYLTEGTYSVNLTVTDKLGQVVRKNVSLAVDPELYAAAVLEPAVIDQGESVAFSGSGAGGTGTYVSYLWDFGDGNSSDLHEAVHEYAKAGTFAPTFTVTDSAGYTSVATSRVLVHSPMLVSAIAASSSSPTTASSVRFSVTVSAGTPGYSYTWNSGDGQASTAASPSFSFPHAGKYSVQVEVVDAARAVIVRQLIVSVTAAPVTLLDFLSHGIGLYTFSAALAAVAFLLAVLFLRRRARGGASPAGEDGTGSPGADRPAPPEAPGGGPPSGGSGGKAG